MQRFCLNILSVLLLAGLAGVTALWVRSYFVPDVIESYADVPAPPLGQARPWDQRERWEETTWRSYPGRFEVVWTTTKVKGRRHGADFAQSALPAPVRNGWTFSQRDDAGRSAEDRTTAGAAKRTFGSWEIDFIRPVKIQVADYQELRQTSGRGLSAPYWAVALALGLLPAMRLFNTTFRLGRDTHDLLGHRQPGTGFRGQFASAFRLASAGSVVLIVATGILWQASQRVSVRFEGRSGPAFNPAWAPPEWLDRQTLIANKAGLYVKAASTPGRRQEPRPETLPPCRYELTLGVPSVAHPTAGTAGYEVQLDKFGVYVATVRGTPAGGGVADVSAEHPATAPSADESTAESQSGADPDTAVATVEEEVNVPRIGALPPDAPLPEKPKAPEPVDAEWLAFFPYWSLIAAFSVLPALQVWFYMHPPRESRKEKPMHRPLRGMPTFTSSSRPI